MADFMKAMETYRENDIQHHGVKGMRWGVRTQQPYVPVAQRREAENQNDTEYDSRYYETPVQNIYNAPPQKAKSTGKKIAIGLATGIGVAGIITGVVLGIKKKNEPGADSILTEAGRKLKEMAKGGKK